MSEDTPQNESIEERLTTIEDQLDELEIDDIERRITNIESEQSQLRNDLTEFVEALREQNEEIPHIDSVEGLYMRLQSLEKDIATLRESLEDIVDESN